MLTGIYALLRATEDTQDAEVRAREIFFIFFQDRRCDCRRQYINSRICDTSPGGLARFLREISVSLTWRQRELLNTACWFIAGALYEKKAHAKLLESK